MQVDFYFVTYESVNSDDGDKNPPPADVYRVVTVDSNSREFKERKVNAGRATMNGSLNRCPFYKK